MEANEYKNSMHRFGRISVVAALAVMFGFVAGTCIFLDASIEWGVFFTGLLSVSLVYLPICVAEVTIFSPVLGTGATYLTFITGNITNLKLPCIINALNIADVEEGSEEADVLATLASAASSFTTAAVMIVGVILLIPLTPLLQAPVLQPAFGNLLPILFGAVGATYLAKSVKLGLVPIGIAVVIYLLFPAMEHQTSIMIFLMLAVSIVSARIFYKKGWVNP